MGSLVQMNPISFTITFNKCHIKRKKSDSRMDDQDRLPAQTIWHFLRDQITLRSRALTMEFSAVSDL